MIEEQAGDAPRGGARRGEAFATEPDQKFAAEKANASLLHRSSARSASRPLWLRLLGLVGVVLLLALAGAWLGRGFGAVTPAAVMVQTVAPAAVPTALATQAAVAPAPVLGAVPTARPADPAPAAIPVPAATPVADASAAWPVQLAESFDQASQSWPEVLGPSWWSRYHDGGYEMALAGRPSMSYSSPLPAHDFWLAADVRVARGRAGLFFLLGRPNDFYRFLIDAEGRYRLEWQQVGYARPLIDWTASDALRPGDRAINQIAVRRVGDTLRLYANGTLLGSYDLPPGSTLEGRVGLALDAPEGERAALAWFDNLEVRAPDHK